MKNLFFAFAVVFLAFEGAAQVEVGDAVLPETETFEGQTLVLNGAGVREKFWIDLYAAALYLEERSSDAKNIITSKKPMSIKLHIVSQLISSDKMIDAVRDGFEKSTDGNTAPIQPEIEKLIGFFKEDIQKNDVFDLVYVPSVGVVAYKNGEKYGTVKGEAFKEALFGIWLSDDPANDDLKKELLGKG